MDNACGTVNLDIGGGTTNIVVFQDGETVAKGCLDIGGRLIRVNENLVVESISPAAQEIANAVGASIKVGARTTYRELSAVTDKMADLLAQALGLQPQEPLLRKIQTPESSWLQSVGKIKAICFSGGVADCIGAEAEGVPYGDIGILLGRSIRKGVLYNTLPCIAGSETIRATVVGAGTYTTSISGSTIDYAEGMLPMKNIPALRLNDREEADCFAGFSAGLSEQMSWFLEQSGSDLAVLALKGDPDPDYETIRRLARCLAEGLDQALPQGKPIIILLEHDIAKVLGMAPHKIMRKMALAQDFKSNLDDPIIQSAALCCECDICEAYACPMGLQPRKINSLLKKELGASGFRYQAEAGRTYTADEERELRKVPSERLAARVGVLPYYHNSIKELVEDEPNSVSIPLKMHIGAPSVPVVAPGDEVKCGQLIAACPDGALGSNIHASISGRVTAVGSTIEIAGF